MATITVQCGSGQRQLKVPQDIRDALDDLAKTQMAVVDLRRRDDGRWEMVVGDEVRVLETEVPDDMEEGFVFPKVVVF